VQTEGLQELIRLFDQDGDGVIDAKEIQAAQRLVLSMKAAMQKDEDLSEMEKLDSVKREEQLARMKMQEKQEAHMRQAHVEIQARLEARRKKRTGAIDKMEHAVKEEDLQKKIGAAGGGSNIDSMLGGEGRAARESLKQIDMADLMASDEEGEDGALWDK
jgi:hypothetical protein